MVLEISNIDSGNGSCNFCSKGKGDFSGVFPKLIFPYEKIVTISRETRGSVSANFCKECLDELIEKSKDLEF